MKFREVTSYTDAALAETCIYVFYHPGIDKSRPFYIGKAKRFGGIPASRYNGGYKHLISGFLNLKFRLFVADLGDAFSSATHYEQTLIDAWNPICEQRRLKNFIKREIPAKPWEKHG